MKYVFWGPEFKPAYAMFKEAFKLQDVIYVRFLIPSYIIVKIFNCFKLSRTLIKKYITRIKVDKDEAAIFIYYNPWGEFLAKSGCLNLIKEKYKKSFHVVNLYDAVVAKKLDIKCLKEAYEKVYIYDQKIADALDISYLAPCYSKNFETPSENLEIYDVSFVGHAKNRLSEIISIYEKLTAFDLKCNFYIVGADQDAQKYKDKITYGSRYLNEEEYFRRYIAPSKCLLEIGNAGVDAITARVREAVMYDKKVLSNNLNIKNYKYYNENMMHIYENIEDIDRNFFDMPKQSYNYEGDFSPHIWLDKLKKEYEEWENKNRS